jgi:methyl-accepting chemotaxis protein
MPDEEQRRRSHLASRLALAVAGVAIVPLLLAGASIGWLARRQLVRQRNETLISRAENFAQVTQASILEPLARDVALRRWIREPELRVDHPLCATTLARLVERTRTFRGAALLDAAGEPRCASDEATARRWRAAASETVQARWFGAAADGALSSAGVRTLDGERVVDLALGSRSGILIASLRWEVLSSLLSDAAGQVRARTEQDRPRLLVVDPDGLLFDSRPEEALGFTPRWHPGEGAGDAGPFAAARAAVDAAPTDIGGRWSYVALVPRRQADAAIQRMMEGVGVLVVAAAVAAALVSRALAARVVRPIGALTNAVERIVRDGDLTQTLQIDRTDEIGRLASSFSAMMEKLRHIPLTLAESAQLLGEAVAALESGAAEQAILIERQAAALRETQDAAARIRETSALANQRAGEAVRTVDRVGALGSSGERNAEQTVSGMTDLFREVQVISDEIAKLGEGARRIGGITETVKDLADQSNMLALNAAIEAVRSGEHGKGFAVVAREIRSLADQSIQATRRVRDNLDQIGAAIGTAVSTTERGSQRMASALESVRSSGESLRELSSLTRQGSEAVRDIVSAVAEQDVGIGQVASSIDDLSNQMDETRSRIELVNGAVRNLGVVSAQITRLVQGFRVRER